MQEFLKKLIREPLIHFLIIGTGLFLLFGWGSGPVTLPAGQSGLPSTKIVIAPSDIDQMTAAFTRTWQRPPTETEVKVLVDNFVRDEIYYREGLAIGLDRDDSVIRRRMRQKMEFIFEDITAQAEPTDDELLAYMKTHPDAYLMDPQIAFRHVYFNANMRGKNAEADARQILASLNEGMDAELAGDPFMLGAEISLSPLWDIRKQFGEEFSRNLSGLMSEKWEGPLRSGFGLHLVLVIQRVASRLPELEEVRKTVKRDLMAERQKELMDAAYAKLRDRYTVEMERSETKALSSAEEKMPQGVLR